MTAADLAPMAFAIVASPFAIIPAILLVLSDRPRANGWTFLAGWLLSIAVATGAFVLLTDVISLAEDSAGWISWARIGLGVILIALGVRRWLGRRSVKDRPAWMSAISTATPRRALLLALLLSLANPKILVLAAAAGLTIGAASITVSEQALWVLAFSAVAALTVAAPVLAYTVLGQRVLRPLSAAQRWLERHNSAVMAIIFVIIGAIVATTGIQGL